MECFLRAKDENGRGILVPDRHRPAPDAREVFVFPGSKEGKRESHRRLGGLMKLIERGLGGGPGEGDVAVIGVNYRLMPPLTKPLDKNITRQFYADPDHYASPDAVAFVQQQLIPRLLPEAEGKPPVTTLQERMSRLTFIAHSIGGLFSQMVCNELYRALDGRGYTNAEIGTICQSGVLISTAGTNFVRTAVPRFTELTFQATNDHLFSKNFETYHPFFPNQVDKIRQAMGIDNLPEGFSIRQVPTGLLIASPVPTQLDYFDGQNERTIGGEGKPDITHDPQPHWCLPSSPGPIDNSLAVKLKIQVLQKAVTRGPGLPDPAALLTQGSLLTSPERALVQGQLAARKTRGLF